MADYIIIVRKKDNGDFKLPEGLKVNSSVPDSTNVHILDNGDFDEIIFMLKVQREEKTYLNEK